MIDGDSVTAQLCAAGMAVDGNPTEAHAYFCRAWDARRDDYEAAIAAHFVARHQASAADTLHWNRVAVAHAEAVSGDRALPLLVSLYLNLGDSYLAAGQRREADIMAERGLAALAHLVEGGYRAFVARGLARLKARVSAADVLDADI